MRITHTPGSARHGTLFPADLDRVRLIADALVAGEAGRCVQCGVCNQACPVGIDVRAAVRTAGAVTDARCMLCGTCVARCPRGNLVFVPLARAS